MHSDSAQSPDALTTAIAPNRPVATSQPLTRAAIAIDLDALSASSVLDRFLRVADAVRANGTTLIGLTNSRRCDVLQTFPGILSQLDALIYEHGCVVEVEGRLYPRARPVPQGVGLALRRGGVSALSGQVTITARDQGVAATLVALGGAMGVEVVAGPAGAIIIPEGVSRSAAIEFVLDRLGLPRDVIREVSSPISLNETLATLAG